MSESTRSRRHSKSRSPSRSRSKSRSRSRSKSPKSRKERKKRKKEKKADREKRREKREDDEQSVPDKRNVIPDDVGDVSVDEANRIRAELGIEPLAPAAEDEAEARDAELAQARQKVNEERAQEESIREEKRKKVLAEEQAKLNSVDSLGRQLERETGGSAKEWVQRSRALGQRAEAEKRAASLAEQEESATPAVYDSENLAGLKVDHTAAQFEEGKAYTMTLKDTNILTKDANEENVEEDTLENIELVGHETLEKHRKLKTRGVALYNAYDEEANTVLLPQYEDEKEKETSRLTGEEDEKLTKTREIREKLRKTLVKVEAEDDTKVKVENLFTPQNVVSDYLPAKPVKFKQRRKKENGARHERTTLKAEVKGQEKRPEASFDEDVPDVAEHQLDHGSRQGGSVKERNDALQADRRKQLKDSSYLRALEKAEKDNKKLMQSIEHVFEDEQDEELQSSLDRSRRLAHERDKEKRKKLKEAVPKTDDAITAREKKFAETIKQIPIKEEPSLMDDDMDETIDTEAKNEALVLTATTEFCRGLSAPALDSVQPVDDSKFRPVELAKVAKEDKPRAEPDNEDDLDDDEDGGRALKKENDAQDMEDFMGEEPMANKGAAAALALAKLRGLLKEEVSQAGRSQDEAYHYDDPAPNISLVYTDEFGRPMKPKEAFRQLSHVFHGRPPGPVKQEKKLKQFREEQRRGRILYGSRKSTLENFVKKQKKQGQAHVVLEGSKKGAYDVGAGIHAGNPKRKRLEDDLMSPGGI